MILDKLVPQASTYAEDVDFVWEFIFWTVGVWTVAAFGVFFYFIFKFKKKDGVKAQYITGEEKEQKKWVSIPHMLVLVCDVFVIIFAVQVWYAVKQDVPEDDNALEIRVIAQQWAWTFVHPGPDRKLNTPDDIYTTDELHVTTDQMYIFHLESRDVMHDFSVPVFRLKQDAIPGRVITGWFKTNQTTSTKASDEHGEYYVPYDIQCAEMCGIGHGIMGASIYIESREDHQAWLQENAPIDPTQVAGNNEAQESKPMAALERR